jgi:serine acetyltransferase
MLSDFKAALKRLLSRHALVALWVARARSRVLGLLALPLRLRLWVTAYVPFSVKLVGIRRISIGHNTVVGAYSWLNVNDLKGAGPALSIGKHCFIGMGNYFGVAKSMTVGDYCLTAKDCSFIGAMHAYDDPMQPYATTGMTTAAVMVIGPNCFFGLGAQVIGNVQIGHGCVVGAGAVVRENMPPFSLVVGNPARVVKRFDFASKTWVKWPAKTYDDGPSEADYLAYLRQHTGAPVHHISAASGALRDLA